MNAEQGFSIRPEDILAAERARPTRPDAAVHLLHELDIPNVSEFPSFGDEEGNSEKTLFLQAEQILAISHIGQANRADRAAGVAFYLGEAKRVMETVYHHPAVAADMKTRTKDYWGNPYAFESEALQHQAMYNLTLLHLTGNAGFLHQALSLLDAARGYAADESAQTLAQFRKSRLLRQTAEAQKRPTFAEYFFTYVAVRDAALEAKQWERVATVSARFAYDACVDSWNTRSINKIRLGLGAVKTWFGAAIRDPRTVLILPKEWYKEITDARRHKKWRDSAVGGHEYEKHLALSNPYETISR